MPVVKLQANTPYSPAQMYALVNDIPRYPGVLRWCRRAEVVAATEDEIKATLHLQKGPLKKSFTTANRLQQDKMIEISLVDGPFAHMHGFWLFDAKPQGAEIRFSLDFEFNHGNWLLNNSFRLAFSQIAHSLVDAFCERAHEVYGGG